MAGRFGSILSSLSVAAMHAVRRNAADSGWEAFDTTPQMTPLFDHFSTRPTASTSAETKHLYNISQGQFSANGDRIEAEYTVKTDSSAGDCYARVKFGSTTVFDSGADIDPSLGNSHVLKIRAEFVRVNPSTLRVTVTGEVKSTPYVGTRYEEITGLDLNSTAYDLKLELATENIGDMALYEAHGKYYAAAASPLVTTSLWAAYDARYYNGVGVAQPSDGATLSAAWQDISGNARHASVTGSPFYETGEFNGLPVVRYPGGTVYHVPPSMSGLSEGMGFFALKITDVTTDAGNLFGTSGNADHYPYTPDNPDGIYSDFGSDARKSCGGSIAVVTDPHSLMIWSKASDWGLYQNGSKVFETTSNTVGFPSSPKLGHNATSGMKMHLAAAYFYSAKLSDANIAKQLRYMGREFGV